MIDSILLPFKITGTKITIPFTAICSVTDKEFGGDVVIEYHPAQKALEYVHAEKVISTLSSKKTTAEELAHLIHQEVNESINPHYLKILINVKHSKAHQPVEVWVES